MRSDSKNIPLIKPLMPKLDEFAEYLENIWESGQLTNHAKYVQLFEKQLSEYLDVKHISLCANATLGLMIALKSMDLKGEIITTPFTWVSTGQAIHWNNLKPVFVDIDEQDFNLSLLAVKEAIGPDTSAILPVHVFGNPCKPLQLAELAAENNIKVIFDAAHAFGAKYHDKALCTYGDLSVLSFHATKAFNSLEGGAIISKDEKMKAYIDSMINYGFDANGQLQAYGLNAHLNELQAAFGLLQLKQVDWAIAQRKKKHELYSQLLKNMDGIRIPDPIDHFHPNYSFFPIIIDECRFGCDRNAVREYLARNHITTRTYFHPLVSDYKQFSMYKKTELKNARKLSDNTLCLPLHQDLKEDEIIFIVEVLGKLKKSKKLYCENITSVS